MLYANKMTDKLLTLKEAAEGLGLSEEEVRRLVEKGEIPAYQIGGVYLRFKEEQILSLQPRYLKKTPAVSIVKEKEIFKEKDSFISRIQDFFYFSNFYIVSALIIAVLLYIIYESIR